MKKNLIIYASYFLLTHTASKVAAQDQCGTDQQHQKLMQTDSAYQSRFLSLQNQIHAIINNQSLTGTTTQVYTIPVVVHVIHLGKAVGTGTNISDAQIQAAITGLNNKYSNLIGNGSLNTEISFCLAVRSPTGCPTNGINRVNGSGIPDYTSFGIRTGGCATGANEESVKSLSRWPVADYYNIWVVNNICSGQWGGYAYYPNGGVNDGTLIRAAFMNGDSYLLPHEVGHGLFLYHTFEGDGSNTSCPVNTDCTLSGDRCCDTPPHKQNDCGTSNPCSTVGIWDNTRYNYMSYCVPSIGRFTPDQKARMQAVMAVPPRASLVNSLGCTPASFTATITSSGPTSFCSGGSVTLTSNAANSYLWSNGAITQSIIVTTAGNYSVTATNSGSCSATSSVTTVSVNQVPPQPSTISGSTSVISGQTLAYAINTVTGATGYNWQLSGGGTIGSGQNTTSITINWATAGTYTLSVNSVNSCGNSIVQSVTIVVSIATGVINPDNQFLITVTPNPSTGEFYLTAKGLTNKKVEIGVANTLGQVIYQLKQVVSNNDFTKAIDLRKMPDGIYYIKISVDKKKYIRIITKQN